MAKVTYKNTGQSSDYTSDQNLREITQGADWDIPYACENGICGTCLVKVKAGKDQLSEPEEQEKQTLQALGVDDGEHRLACQCKLKGGDVVIES